jgi:hypothetical protein
VKERRGEEMNCCNASTEYYRIRLGVKVFHLRVLELD